MLRNTSRMRKPVTKNQTLHLHSRPPMTPHPVSHKPPQQSNMPLQARPKKPPREGTPAHPRRTPAATGTTKAAPMKPQHHRRTRTGIRNGGRQTSPPPTTTATTQCQPPQQPQLSSKTPRNPQKPWPRRWRKHRPVPTASSSKPPQPPDPPRGSATPTGEPEDYPQAPHAGLKQQQDMGHRGFATKPASMFTNSITNTATGSGAHPLRAKGDRGGASCIGPKPRTTIPHRVAAAATAGNNRATAAPPARVGGITHHSPNPRQPNPAQRQTPMPKNASQTSSTGTCCHGTRFPAAHSKEDRQQASPKPKLKPGKNPSNTTHQQDELLQTTYNSHSRISNHGHPLAPPQTHPRRGTAPTQPKQSAWAATQPDFETPPDLPPDFSLPTASAAPTEFTTLTHGCWECPTSTTTQRQWQQRQCNRRRKPQRTARPLRPLPGTGRAAGPSPTLYEGDGRPHRTNATRERMAPHIITSAPHLDDYEHNTMLTVEGDKFMIEATDKGWRLRVEHLAPSTARAGRPPTRPPRATAEPDSAAPGTKHATAADLTAPTIATNPEVEAPANPQATELTTQPGENPDDSPAATNSDATTTASSSNRCSSGGRRILSAMV